MHRFQKEDLPGCMVLVVHENLLTELVDKLVKAEVHLSLNFIIKELLSKLCQSVMGTVIVKVQWV